MLNIKSGTLSATLSTYQETDGTALQQITLENGTITVQLINLGATITSIHTPDRTGSNKNIVAGFAHPHEYRDNPAYFGSTVGRYANRIAGGRLTIGNMHYQLPVNNGNNHLHGGVAGFHKKAWQVTSCTENEEQAAVTMEYVSRTGEEGYPGTLTVHVTYALDLHNRLSILYMAYTDQATVVSLTNHSYFNLTGFEQPLVTDHLLRINATAYTEKNDNNTPTGQILPVAGTPLDFTSFRPIGTNIDLLTADGGFDHNYVLDHASSPSGNPATPAAELEDPSSGRFLQVFTDQPGLQLYSANYWDGSLTGAHGRTYLRHGAVALETQAFPDSPNQPHFPNTILRPGEIYKRETVFAFGVR